MFRKMLLLGVVALGCSLVTPESAEAWGRRGVYVGRGPVRVATGYRGFYGPRVVAPVRHGFYGPVYGPRFYRPRGVSVVVGGGGWYGW